VRDVAKLLTAVLLLGGCVGGPRKVDPFRDAPPFTPECVRRVNEVVEKGRGQGLRSLELRRLAEEESLRCEKPKRSQDVLRPVSVVNADLSEASRAYLEGTLSGLEYRRIVRDRTGKYRKLQSDKVWRDAYALGDQDGDLVPDALDRCPDTRPFQPTDTSGCPLPQVARCPRGQVCPSPAQDRLIQNAAAKASVMINPACEDAPVPLFSNPLEYGRGKLGKTGPFGFNLALTKVAKPPKGCDIFYIMEMTSLDPPDGYPSPREVRFMFKSSEDLAPEDERRAFFGLSAQEDSPERMAAWEFLGHTTHFRWKVQTVDGAGHTRGFGDPVIRSPKSDGLQP